MQRVAPAAFGGCGVCRALGLILPGEKQHKLASEVPRTVISLGGDPELC